MAKIKIALSASPADAEVDVHGFGTFTNNGEYDVEDWQVAQWEETTGRTWPESGTLTLPEVFEAAEVTPEVEVEPAPAPAPEPPATTVSLGAPAPEPNPEPEAKPEGSE